MSKSGRPYLPDLTPFIAAGIDPKTGLPVKFSSGLDDGLKDNIKKLLRIVDEQDATNGYVWYNLPCNITSQELERMLYYRGQLCFFYDKDSEQFYFMPYTLDGTIDFYGRYNRVHPIPFVQGEDDKANSRLGQLLSEKKLDVQYGLMLDENVTAEDLDKKCVILHDYTKQLSQSIIPRANLQDPILDVMSNCIPYMNTNLLLSTGIEGVRVNDADQSDSVDAANRSMKTAALTGKGYVPIVGNIEFQELNAGKVAKSEEYMLAMQSLDNFRLSTYGIDNGGLFEKKAHELQSEADINGGPVGLVMQDGLSIRQNFANIANSIWGTSIWCEPAQNIIGSDIDGDGLDYDRNDNGQNGGVEDGDDSTI